MWSLLLKRLSVLVFVAAVLAGCSLQQLQEGAQPPVASTPGAQARRHGDAAKNGYKVIHSFTGADGQRPLASLLYLNGKLYGTTEYGGNSGCYYGCGTVFAATTSGQTRVVHRFAGSGKDGQLPQAGVIAVKDKLYGTTAEGGTPSGGAGTVYETTTSGQEQVLYTFSGRGDGATPTDDLVEAGDTLYGTTKYGNSYHYTCDVTGDEGCGTVFSLTLSGKEKILHNFTSSLEDGYWPYAGLLFSKGELYGTTGYGGTAEDGTVFKISPAGKEHVLHSFTGGHDGYFAYSPLTELNGEFYGTTTGGGAYGFGAVFAIDATGKERIVYAFKGGPNDGYLPEGRLVAVNGKLYGTTVIGGAFTCSASGAGCGTVFEVTPAGAESILHNFKGRADGATPWAGLTPVNGMLYGTTGAGGTGKCSEISSSTSGCGTIFEIAP